LTAVAYPAMTAILCGLAVRLVVLGGARGGAELLLGVWIGGELAADIFYGYLSASGTFYYGHPISVGWLASYTALAALALHPGLRRLTTPCRDQRFLSGWRLWSLLAAVLVPLGFALFDAEHAFPEVVGSGGVLLVIVRLRLMSGDLAEQRRLARDLERLSRIDALTGLGNRRMFMERLDHVLLQRPVGAGAGTGVLLLDLDGFKEVNDILGHDTGDAVLVEVAGRLSAALRSGDTIARLGGDEFGVILEQVDAANVAWAAERVVQALGAPLSLRGRRLSVWASVGVYVAERDADPDACLKNADVAMYAAKARGGNQAAVFDPVMFATAEGRLRLEREVADAVAAGQFVVYYQPIVDGVTGETTSLEALARWNHPNRGVVAPSGFLAAAKNTGAIVELGEFVLRTACENLSRWRVHRPDLCVAVNLSHRQLLQPDLARSILHILSVTGLPADALHLEITETVMADEDEIRGAIEGLVALGVRLSIDDFGTGHSSLSRLRDLPAERLKIDKSFIREIEAGVAPLLTSIITLAHSLGRTVVAEGVETAEQLAFLLDNRCDEVQGYLFSRPVPATQVVPLLLRRLLPGARAGHESTPVFGNLIGPAVDRSLPVSEVVEALLRELAALSGLDTTFFTTVDRELTHQVTRCSHNAGPLTIAEGLTVKWEDTLCRRLLEDDVVASAEVGDVYHDVEVARALGIETYVSVPIRDGDGALIGTLCGASVESRPVDSMVVELMQLFADVLAERLSEAVSTSPPEPPGSDVDHRRAIATRTDPSGTDRTSTANH
ncbi:MAG: EAL domain-containing protein, partial [Actinobacteria bacterium]|nr:EAL domain-containing protein [Actinomycetota bacterium]